MFLALHEIRRGLVRFGLLAMAISLSLFLVLFQQALQDGLLTSFVGALRNQSAKPGSCPACSCRTQSGAWNDMLAVCPGHAPASSAAGPAVAAAGCSPTSSTSADPHPHTRKVPPDELRLLAELQRQSAYPSVTLLLNTSPGSVLSTAERTRAGQLLDTAAARLRGDVDDGVAAGSSTSSACCSTSSPVSPPALRWRSACRPPAPHR